MSVVSFALAVVFIIKLGVNLHKRNLIGQNRIQFVKLLLPTRVRIMLNNFKDLLKNFEFSSPTIEIS